MTLTQQVLAKLDARESYIRGLLMVFPTGDNDRQTLSLIRALRNQTEKHGITATGLEEHEYCYECNGQPSYPCRFIVELAKDLEIVEVYTSAKSKNK